MLPKWERGAVAMNDPIDALVRVVQLTSGTLVASIDIMLESTPMRPARWQILRAVGKDHEARTVPYIARRLALSRQAVQRVANDLVNEGLLTFEDNPHHLKAKLLRMTAEGRACFAECENRYGRWLAHLAEALTPDEIARTAEALRKLDTAARVPAPSPQSGAD